MPRQVADNAANLFLQVFAARDRDPEPDPLAELVNACGYEDDPKRAAAAAGLKSPPCDPKEVVYAVRQRIDRKPPKRPLSRPQALEWMVQAGVDAVLGSGGAILLLRVFSYTSRRQKDHKLCAWISRGTLARIADTHRKTVDRHAGKLTGPLYYDGTWHAPLFRIVLDDRGLNRRAVWVPLREGWRQLIAHLALTAQARRDAYEAKRGKASARKGFRDER